MTGRPALAVITLDARGGGVAAVSRLLRQVVLDRWGRLAPVVELSPRGAQGPSTPPTHARLRFGARLALEHTLGRCAWTLYGHLAVARVQSYVPRACQRPYAVFLHGIEAWRPLTTGQRALLTRAAIRIANSRYTAARVLSAHPDIGPVAVCPLALSPDQLLAADAPGADARPPSREPVVLVVGRMVAAERYKGHDELLEAWPRVIASVPDATLLFVGEGDDTERLQAKAAVLGVARHVAFTGFAAAGQLQSLYRSASLFAMPSREEGFGLVYLEAMAHGLPCIGSPHDAAQDVIADHVTGVLVDPADTTALADRMVELLTNHAKRSAMGQAARRRVHAEFTYPRFRDGLLSLLDAAAGDRSSSTHAASVPAGSRAT